MDTCDSWACRPSPSPYFSSKASRSVGILTDFYLKRSIQFQFDQRINSESIVYDLTAT